MLARDKHASLLCFGANDKEEEKVLYRWHLMEPIVLLLNKKDFCTISKSNNNSHL
jgi:hypothetical protein